MRRFLIVAAVAAIAVPMAGCGIFDDPPTAPTVTQTVIVNTGNTAPASPAPSPSASPTTAVGAIEEVRVVLVGENCPAGITPSGLQRTVKVGCSGFVTCTPKVRNASGELVDAAPSVHGPRPASFGLDGQTSAFSFTAWDTVPFNADIRALSPGAAVIQCTVGAKSGSNIFVAAP